MDSTKNFFDAWVSTQNKLVDNWVVTSKKIQESMNQGNVMEKSMELYNDWFKNQKTIMDSMTKDVNGNVKMEQFPTYFKDWMEKQTEMGKSFIDSTQSAMKGYTNGSTPETYVNNTNKIFENWNTVYNQWMHQFGKPLSQFKPYIPGEPTMDTFNGMMNMSKAYTQMFEVWQPFYKAMQNNMTQAESLSKMVNFDKYKEIIENLFQITTPDAAKKFFSQFSGNNNPFGAFKDMPGQWGAQIEKFWNMMPNTLSKEMQSMMQMSFQMADQLHKFTSPLLTLLPPSKEKEMFQNIMYVQGKYNQYYMKSVEMQTLINHTAQGAMHKVIKETSAKVSQDKKVATYDEFFTHWMDVMEQNMLEMFKSTEFSEIQGELVNIGAEIKKVMDKQMETLLAPFPIAPRSELDELTERLHELKTKVRELEKNRKAPTNNTVETEATEEKKNNTTKKVALK